MQKSTLKELSKITAALEFMKLFKLEVYLVYYLGIIMVYNFTNCV